MKAGSTFFWNAGKLQPDYKAWHPRRQYSSETPPEHLKPSTCWYVGVGLWVSRVLENGQCLLVKIFLYPFNRQPTFICAWECSWLVFSRSLIKHSRLWYVNSCNCKIGWLTQKFKVTDWKFWVFSWGFGVEPDNNQPFYWLVILTV